MNLEIDISANQVKFEKLITYDRSRAVLFGRQLDESLYTFHRAYDGWVQDTLGGRSYSDTVASGLYFLLRFLGKDTPQELDRLLGSSYPKYGHILWRTISAIDDAVDQSDNRTHLSWRTISDSDGVPLSVLHENLTQDPSKKRIASAMNDLLLWHTRRQESDKHISFQAAKESKSRTTGVIAKLNTWLIYRALERIYFEDKLSLSWKELGEHASASAHSIQIIDDMNDAAIDIGYPTSSSLLMAACRDTNEIPKLENIIQKGNPITGSVLLYEGFKASVPIFIFQHTHMLRLKRASADMISYLNYTFMEGKGSDI